MDDISKETEKNEIAILIRRCSIAACEVKFLIKSDASRSKQRMKLSGELSDAFLFLFFSNFNVYIRVSARLKSRSR